MPWSGVSPNQQFTRTDGTRNGSTVWQQAAAASVPIDSPDHDTHDQDIGGGLNLCVKKDGGNTATGNLPMGGFKHTNVAVASAQTDYAAFSDHVNNKGRYVPTVGGTADAITLTTGYNLTQYVAGQEFTFVAAGTNTGVQATVNVDGIGVVNLNGPAGTNSSAGLIVQSAVVTIRYNGPNSRFEVATTAPTAIAVGTIMAWPAVIIPSGWLECNGQSLSTTTYAALFAAIGYAYGGSGANFSAPDYRGYFLRGQNDGSGNDPDAASRTSRGDGTTGDNVGTKQTGANASHTHTANVTDPGHAHTTNAQIYQSNGQPGGTGGTNFPFNPTTATINSNTTGITVANVAAGGNESRPLNVYVKWIILASPSATFSIGGASITCPLLIGGAGASSTLELRATSGVGVGAEVVKITGGNNGALQFAQFSETPTSAINVYQESGETTRFGADIIRGSDPGSHTGKENSLFVVEHRPVGSGTNGPTNADYGFTISTLKHNFASTSVVGEVDGIASVIRQGGTGSDCAAYLANVGHCGTGYSAVMEGVTSITPSGGAATKTVRVQLGVLDNVGNNYNGFFTNADLGTLGDAYRADSTSGQAWTNLFNGLESGSPVFVVAASGATTITNSTVGLTVARNNSSTTSQFSIEQASTGDASMRWQIDSVRAWLAGIDNSDSQSWKLSPADDGYATAVLRIATGGGHTVMPNTAIPAGGTAGAGMMVSSTANFGIFFGSGTPTLSAAQGSLYLRSDGAINARLYINTNGSTGWTAFSTAS